MGIGNKNPGPNFTPAYQLSGVPFVTTSAGTHITTTPVEIEFPFVTRFFEVTNLSDQVMRVGFTANGVNGRGKHSATAAERGNLQNHYLVLSGNKTSGRLELRCKKLFFRADAGSHKVGFSLVAGLTGIEQFPPLTGTYHSSASFEGVG